MTDAREKLLTIAIASALEDIGLGASDADALAFVEGLRIRGHTVVPQIALTPGKDVVEGAREILPCICTHAFRDNGLHVHGCPWGAYGKNVVAFAEAHAAKEREACAAWHDTEADRHRKISASCRAQGVIGTALVYAKKWQFHEECAAAIRARGAK